LTKTIFNSNSQITASWFNTQQNLQFVANPNNDGQHPLILPSDVQPGVFDSRYLSLAGGSVTAPKTLTAATEVVGGNLATLSSLQQQLTSTITSFSSDGTLLLSQSGLSVQVAENPTDSVIELGAGNVLLKSSQSLPSTSGKFLVQVTYPFSFIEQPFILSLSCNKYGLRVAHMLEDTTSGFACVVSRVATATINDQIKFMVKGRVSNV
jgi:hypothetical protein